VENESTKADTDLLDEGGKRKKKKKNLVHSQRLVCFVFSLALTDRVKWIDNNKKPDGRRKNLLLFFI
jgi:hypothetical protein